ncbi:MAG: serine hydrolase domain-containing protein [Bacillota bacterium]|nr:serine hydrolase domain-containing protein [Bacillota bacterium]
MQKTSQSLITAVENGLRYPVKIKGEIVKPMTLQERMLYHKVPGISIAVVDQGKIVWAKGYGFADVETQQPVDENTLFQAASISKMVTAMGALLLVQQGKVDLDTNVDIYLKRWKVPKRKPYEKEPLTLRQLLSHTGGITVSGIEGYLPDEKIPTLFEFLNGDKHLSKNDAIEMALKPGEHHYSGGGTTIVEVVLEDVTGLSFKDYIQKSVFDPLQMTRSYFVRPIPKEETNFTSGHDTDGKPIPGKYRNHPSFSAAGLWTTPTDLAKLGLNIQNSLRGEKAGLLNQKFAKKMTAPTLDSFCGLGCFIRKDRKLFKHTGSNLGMQCVAEFLIENQKGVVIMMNSENGEELEPELRYSVYDAYHWPLLPNLEKAFSKIESSVLRAYAGEYWRIVNKGMPQEKSIKWCTLRVKDGHLAMQRFIYGDSEWTTFVPGPLQPIYPESSTTFFTRQGLEMTFVGETQFKVGEEIFFKK